MTPSAEADTKEERRLGSWCPLCKGRVSCMCWLFVLYVVVLCVHQLMTRFVGYDFQPYPAVNLPKKAVPKGGQSNHTLFLYSSANLSTASTDKTPLKRKRKLENDFYTTASPKGRLGNQMFQYASLLGVVDINNRSLPKAFYPRNSLVAKYFQLTHVSDRSAKGFKVIKEIGSGTYDPKFENLPPENVRLSTYLQSWKYFHRIDSVIRREFTFPQPVRNRTQQQLRKLTEGRENVIKIGVHVRRGDRVGKRIVGHFQLPRLSYYQRAADYFRSKYRDVIFIVVTTDRQWCQKLLEMKDFVLADDAPTQEHLSLLTQCDHVIVSIGTFGWWGGYLGGGDVVYYNNCIYPNMTAKKGFTAMDHFLPQWVGIGD